MKKSIKYTGLLLILMTAISCADSKKSGCYSFTYEEITIDKESEITKADYKVHYKDEAAMEE